MKEIVGIGSCLSEQVARHFSMNYWGKPVSMVRHNRSDQLVSIMNGALPPRFQTLSDILAGFPASDPTNREFIFGQSEEGIGRSTNKDNITLRAAMSRSHIGLVLIDNFMDLTADLWECEGGIKFFSRFPKDVALRRLRRLAPSEAAKNYNEIAKRCNDVWPAAHIVFLHFPFSNYPEGSSRPEWGERFVEELTLPEACFAILPREVPANLLKNGQPHHYHHSVYKEIAAEVHELLTAQSKTKHLMHACSSG